jgi:exopolysaccharide production protein ExoQ
VTTTHSQLDRTAQPGQTATLWCVAALLAAGVICLVHDPNYATARGAALVEDGRGIEDKTAAEGGFEAAQPARSIGLMLLMTAGGICLLTASPETSIRRDGLTLLIVAGLGWAAVSTLWSAEPGTTMRELVRLFIYTGVAASVARRFDASSLCQVLVITLCGSVAAAVTFEVLTGGFQLWQSDYRLTGTMHSNILGVQAAVIAIVAYAFAVRRAPRATLWWTLFVVATAIVYFTKARTALISVVFGAVAVHVVGRPLRDWLLPASVGATLLAAALLTGAMLGSFDGREVQTLSNLGRTDDTEALTGRLPLWNYIWDQMGGHQLQGYGWGAFWLVERTLAAHDALGWFPRHSHDAYLQVVVNLGLIGLAIALSIAVWSLVRAARFVVQTGRPEYSAIVAVFIGMFVNGVAESAFVMPRDMGLFSAAAVMSMVFVHQSAPALAANTSRVWGRRLTRDSRWPLGGAAAEPNSN